MATSIRNAIQEDLVKISKLYYGRKSTEELRWVFSDPVNPEKLNAFVGLDENDELVGVVGYSLSRYTYRGTEAEGVIPMSWMVSPRYRGLLGVKLLKKVYSMGDFLIAIEGSKEAQVLYNAYKLSYVGTVGTYVKLLSPFSYFRSMDKNFILSILHTLRIFPSYLKRTRKVSKSDYSLEIAEVFPEFTIPNGSLSKMITPEYHKWLSSCPMVETFSFCIKKGETSVGVAVCYISRTRRNTCRGRIVHLTDMGDDSVFMNVAAQLVSFLRSEGCCSVSMLGNTSNLKKALTRGLGFYDLKSKKKPYFINNRKELFPESAFTEWHIQYSEGDKAYRDI